MLGMDQKQRLKLEVVMREKEMGKCEQCQDGMRPSVMLVSCGGPGQTEGLRSSMHVLAQGMRQAGSSVGLGEWVILV